MLQIRSLKDTGLHTLVGCLLEAFEGYYVKMPSDIQYWKERFRGARVDAALSYGCFDQDRLVGFIINGVDQYRGKLTAFNTGTGVIPAYRGQRIVDQLYRHALPALREAGIRKCALEVIQANERAIHVYERIGFTTQRSLRCFSGQIRVTADRPHIESVAFGEVAGRSRNGPDLYAWDHQDTAIVAAGNNYTSYLVRSADQEEIGYFTINTSSGYVARCEAFEGDYDFVLRGIQLVSPRIRINNIDPERAELILFLLAAGLHNSIDQYEMEMEID